MMSAPAEELRDIQGLLHSGYGNLGRACLLLLRIADRAAARTWLAAAPVTTAAERQVSTVLQVALTAGGMRALGVAEAAINGFSAEFLSGMAGVEGRSRRLGDTGASAPSGWRWGARRVPDVLVVLCAESDLAAQRRLIATEDFTKGFEILEELYTTDMRPNEPFGFADGFSQPAVDWQERRKPGTTADLAYGNLIAPGEFLLGYRNEYGLYTDRPLLDPASGDAADLPAAEDDPARRDLGRNGSYLVFRELHQDVRGFWRYATAQATDAVGATALAAAMVGRQIDGTPLIADRRQIAGIDATDAQQNGFTYDSDPAGLTCPFGAHVRRANPRTGDMPGGRQGLISRLNRILGFFHPDLREDLIAASRFHRILRRGRAFGAVLPPEAAMRPDAPDPRSGLYFLCLNASISRQFEFIQNAWLMSAKFAGLDGESDPLLGNREALPPGVASDSFSLPQPNGVARHLAGMPQFVTVAGGAYFFLPGLRALRYFSGSRPKA